MDALKESERFSENDLDWLKKQTVKWLKENCLTCNEWHHTSKFYNRTNFYEIKENFDSDSIKQEIDYRAWKVETDHFFNENLDKVITLIDSKGVKHERCKLIRSRYFWAYDLNTNEKFHF